MSYSMVRTHKYLFFLGRMVLEWRECEHEDVDRAVHQGCKHSIRATKAWNIQVLEPWEFEISTKALANVLRLLGSRQGGIHSIWDAVETQGRGYLLHY